MKQRVKITEGQLRNIVKQSVKSLLRESLGDNNEYRIIDNVLSERFRDCHVSFWYSTEDVLCLAIEQHTWREERKYIEALMRKYGYDLYDVGGNGEYIMASWKKYNNYKMAIS